MPDLTDLQRRFILLFVIPVLVSSLTARAASDAPVKIVGGDLTVTLDAASGNFSVKSAKAGRAFIVEGMLPGGGGTAIVVPSGDKVFGGDAIQIRHADGSQHSISLHDGLPFAIIAGTIHNGGTEPTIVNDITLTTMNVDLGVPTSSTKAFGTGGLTDPAKNPGSYAWAALVEPATRHGVVTGWLTHERASGVLFPKVVNGSLQIEARGQYGRLRVMPGTDAETERFLVGWFDDARLGLEAWADAVALYENISLPPQPVGYCTWYSDKHGGSSDAGHLAELATFAARELKPFGFDFVQIDDGWQDGVKANGPRKNFTRVSATGPYAAGMKPTMEQIAQLGLRPGLWLMPFAGNFKDPWFADHQDWFSKTSDGQPFDTKWGGTCLDMSNPAARDYVHDVVSRITNEWGCNYLKLDGLYTGADCRQVYVNAGYKEDHFGEAVLHDPAATPIQAYREGLKVVRESAKGPVFLLGCCANQNMRSYAGAFGRVDAMRVGPDNGHSGEALVRGPTFGTRNYFLHGRIWYNDPDPLYVRESVPLDQARLICSWVTISGQLSADSDWLPGLPSERLDLLRRTMPSHGLHARPVDLFDRELPSVWVLSDTRKEPRRDVVAFFNWGNDEQQFDETAERLGLDAKAIYEGFDYWANATIPTFTGKLSLRMPAHSCRVIAVRPLWTHPILLSTSRHITQGIVDVEDEKWDEAGRVLSGRSKVVANDPYEMRITVPGEGGKLDVAEVSRDDEAAGAKVEHKAESGLLRITIQSPVSREVDWQVRFRR